MKLACNCCGFQESFQEALFCRDCGSPYVEIQMPPPIYPGAQGTFITVINRHSQVFEIQFDSERSESLDPDAHHLLKAAELTYNVVDSGAKQEVVLHFPNLPKPMKNPSEVIRMKFPILVRSFNNTIKLPRMLDLVWSPTPEVCISAGRFRGSLTDDKRPVLYVCPSASAKFCLPVQVTRGIVFVHEIRLAGHTIERCEYPHVLDSDKQPVHELELNLETHPEIEEQVHRTGTQECIVDLRCMGLKELISLPVVLRHLDPPELSLKIDRWTSSGYQTDCEVSLNQGLLLQANPSMGVDRSLLVGLKEDLLEVRRHATMQIFDVKPAHKTVKISPRGPFIIPVQKRKSIGIDPPLTGNIDSSLEFEIMARNKDGCRRTIKLPLTIKASNGKEYRHFIGLDFGTSNSCVAMAIPYQKNGEWFIDPLQVDNLPVDQALLDMEPPRDPTVMPSYVYMGPAHHTKRIGHMAFLDFESSLEREFKTLVLKEGSDLSYIEAFFEEIIRRISLFLLDLGTDKFLPSRIIMTVPTAYSPTQRGYLRNCCVKAMQRWGVVEPQVRLIDESLAAMTYFSQTDDQIAELKQDTDLFMVIDFGGGTTDITVVEKDQNRLVPIIAGGDPEFGGKDVTRWVQEALGLALIQTAEEAKRHLWNKEDWDEYAAAALESITASYEEVAGAVKAKLKWELVRILDDILSDLNDILMGRAKGRDQKKLVVLLAGGASALGGYTELVEEVLREIINIPPRDRPIELKLVSAGKDPKKCVSRGAFIYESGGGTEVARDRNISSLRVLWALSRDTLPPPHTKIIEYSPRVEQTTSSVSLAHRYAVLLERNLPVPTPPSALREMTLFGDLNMIRDSSPILLYTQAGSGPPRPCELRPEDMVPDSIGSLTPFIVYLDENANVRMQMRG